MKEKLTQNVGQSGETNSCWREKARRGRPVIIDERGKHKADPSRVGKKKRRVVLLLQELGSDTSLKRRVRTTVRKQGRKWVRKKQSRRHEETEGGIIKRSYA